MKYFLVFALIIVTACNLQAELTREGILAVKTTCKNELGITDEELKELKNSEITNRKIRCLIDCTYMTVGVMNSERRINKPVAKEYVILGNFTTQDVSSLIEDCSVIEVSDDGCNAAAQYRQCIKNRLT